MQIFEKKGQIPAIWKKRKPSEVRHGRKNAYFWKIQKGGSKGPPWASKSKKAKKLDHQEKNGTAFTKVDKKKGQKLTWRGQIWEFWKNKKVPLENVPRVPCVK